MTTDPQKIKPDRTDDDRPSPRRTVRVVAYGLFALLWLSLPILLYALYNQTKDEAAPRTKLWKYSDLHQIDIATFLADPLREGGHLVPLLDVLARGEHRGQAVRWVTNSKGYRNDSEFAYEVPEGTYRILLMGDSYVDGFRTDQERTIGYLLERHLNNRAYKDGLENHQVMIAGFNNPAAALYNYQEHGRKYGPNLVILGISVGNDITPRSYKLSLWPDRDPSVDGHFKLVFGLRPAEHSQWKTLLLPQEAYTRKSPVFDYLFDRERKIRKKLAKKFSGFGHVRPPVIGSPPNKRYHVHAGGNLTSLGLFYNPLMPEVADWYRDLEEIILAMNGQVTAEGGKLLVVLFPTRAQVDIRDWRLLQRCYALDGSKFRMDYPGNRIGKFCGVNAIDCLDLMPAFEAIVQREGTRLYMKRGDMHFNEAGQALAANVIASHISQTFLTARSDNANP